MARTKSGARARAGRSVPGAPREKAASGRGLPASRVECAPSRVAVGEGGTSRGQQHVELSFEHQQQPHQHPEHRADGEAGDGVRGERLDPLRACKGGAPAGHAPSDTPDTPRTPLGHPGHPPLDAQARGSRRGPLGRPPSIQGRPSEGTTAVRRTRRPTPISLL